MQIKQSLIKLTATEIAGLWGAYMNESMALQISRHFLDHMKDRDIQPLLRTSIQISEKRLKKIKNIFTAEQFPIPYAYSDNDVYSNAPALFTDLFVLSFLYAKGKMNILNYGRILATVIRDDIIDFFKDTQSDSINLYKQAVSIMKEKGLYDRPPKMDYPDKAELKESRKVLDSLFGDKRPLNCFELTELFFNIENNLYGNILMTGFLQVVKNPEIKKYLLKGKKMTEQQVTDLNNFLKEDDMSTLPVPMEITDSSVSPFSDKLILNLIQSLNSSAVISTGIAISFSMRADLAAHFTRILPELLKYANDGLEILTANRWLEQPPQALNRKQMMK